MEKFLSKKYKLERSENLDEMLMEMGMNSLTRKIAKSLPTKVQLTKEGDIYTLHTTILLLSTSQKFKLEEGKDITTPDGRKVHNSFYIEGNKLIEKQVGEKTMTITREFFEHEMIVKSGFENGVRT